MGLVSRVVPRAELDAEVDALARTLAGYSPTALGLAKEAAATAPDMEYGAALRYLRELHHPGGAVRRRARRDRRLLREAAPPLQRALTMSPRPDPGLCADLRARASRGVGARIGVLALRARRPRPGVCEVSASPRATLSGISARVPGGLSVIKIMWAAVVGGAGLLVGLAAGPACSQPKELPAQLVTLGGPAELHKKDAATWTSAALRDQLGEGDSLRTQVGGRVALKTASGQALRLGSRSQLAILPAEAEDPAPRGSVWTTAGSGSRCRPIARLPRRSRCARVPESSRFAGRASGSAARRTARCSCRCITGARCARGRTVNGSAP